jgi:hypothetical protein
MDARKRTPRISRITWGRVEVDEGDQTASFKDVKLWPGGAREWDWNETGTRHAPGIQPADVEELLEHDADVIILTRGMNRRLQVQQETLDWLDERGVDYEILQTEDAVQRINELAENHKVGALIHSTC